MGAKNQVIAGDYKGKYLTLMFGSVSLSTGFFSSINLDKTTVEEYEVMDATRSKSAVSAVGRGFVGSLILGPVGLLAGLSAKEKSTHTIALQFNDGKKSLIEVDDNIYKAIMKKLF
ncbi:hypothetical protein CXK86_10355 [Paenibacillus sp. BGI2013]|uniref:hypothetical protein n=1 Tax=Paenibacillus TaxID=44249 RepID=UPI00096F7B44|nr:MULTISPECIES: hypothetical protein [Paenibacillus]OMF46233.1 hypothetical protein BK136_06225 [Paenibacillus amylolyticus]PKQ91696.1 hypothetical protein CXK86_10355 [Paenibacillus sp. BGI2013]